MLFIFWQCIGVFLGGKKKLDMSPCNVPKAPSFRVAKLIASLKLDVMNLTISFDLNSAEI